MERVPPRFNLVLHWVALIVPRGFVHVCLRFAVGVGSSSAGMRVSCIDSDVHSCF